ncbi:MAG: hypothetical protein LBT89_03810 [Planctomycetaceae bacterium]|jgi:hypothetical protein|nr:hypothetical protein [Planctomycetaceae bacterium]
MIKYFWIIIGIVFIGQYLSGSGSAEELGQLLQTHFAIYNRNQGELELLDGSNTADIDGVLLRTAEKRNAIRQAVQDNVRFENPSAQTVPLLAEHYGKTEQAAAKRSLQRERIDQSVEALQSLFQFSQQLCDAGQYDCRLTAAKLRLQGIPLVQDVLLHPKTRHTHYVGVYEMLRVQLDRWTKDKDIWTEYKTECLRVYALTDTPQQDKPFFEKAVNVMIESCSLPYYKRQPVLRQLKEQVRSGTPAISKDLLKVIPDAMEQLALERTQCEMLYLGLGIALRKEQRVVHTQPPLVPLTGETYSIKLITGGIMITYPGNVKACYVPYRK